MRDAAIQVVEFMRGKSRQDLTDDPMLSMAVTRGVEIIGEAATGVSGAFRVAHPEIPWRKVVGMRNRLIHAYFDVDLNRLWKTVQTSVPELIALVRPLIEEES